MHIYYTCTTRVIIFIHFILARYFKRCTETWQRERGSAFYPSYCLPPAGVTYDSTPLTPLVNPLLTQTTLVVRTTQTSYWRVRTYLCHTYSVTLRCSSVALTRCIMFLNLFFLSFQMPQFLVVGKHRHFMAIIVLLQQTDFSNKIGFQVSQSLHIIMSCQKKNIIYCKNKCIIKYYDIH